RQAAGRTEAGLLEGQLTHRCPALAAAEIFVRRETSAGRFRAGFEMATDCSLRVAWYLRFCLTCLARGERMRHPTPTLAACPRAASAEEIPDDAA
ncbi:hypothetical protein, partial [Mesorhizobium sp. M7D.F.Ca.US.004.03.1.1]|uniref:hypothetical protein n=1 Tax=Mesorhizobium sp. M7D.F.Ca.US.004.03.1.1 TaxID=2496702 RepID=UPI0019D161E4